MANLIDFDTLSLPSQIWHDGTYIYVTAMTTLYAYSFDGSNLTQLNSIATGGSSVNSIWGDGTYIYTHSTASAILRAFTFNGISFTQHFSHQYPGAGYVPSFGYGVRGDGTYVYRSVEGSGGKKLVAYRWISGTFTMLTDTAIGMVSPVIVCQSGAIFLQRNFPALLSKYIYNGISFSFVDSVSPPSMTGYMDGDGTYLYITPDTYSIFVYDNNLNFITTFSEGLTSINGLFCSGGKILVAANDEIRGYTFNGSSFTLVDKAINTGNAGKAAVLVG